MKRFVLISILLLALTGIGLKLYARQTETEHNLAAQKEETRREIEEEPEIPAPEPEEDPEPEVTEPEPATENMPPANGPLICLDAGHQERGNGDPETIAPSSTQTKPKVASGTRGVSTGIDEYVFTLRFSMILKDKLEAAGYRVGMVRDRHDVDISNQERAQIANNMGADLYLRIHANGIGDSSVKGIETYYPSPNNPDIGHLSAPSEKLSQLILQEMASATGAIARGAIARDDLTGTNFATMPSCLIECGYMSNPEEDRLLNDDTYLNKMADGIVQALNLYYQS